MDIGYLHLFQMLLIIILMFGLCRMCVSLPKWSCVPILVTADLCAHPVYYSYRRHIWKKDLYSFNKYQIWRYIEKRKSILLFG